jgi:hypothetical protein
LSKEADTRLAYPCGSWFKIDKIGDNETFVVKGPILNMRVDEIYKLQEIRLRFASFHTTDPDVEEENSPQDVDE